MTAAPAAPPPYDGVAVVIPCLDEAATIDAVVRAFTTALPGADVYVFDNGSTDGTAKIAAAAGAVVRAVPRRGKGFVMRRLFADIDADVYVMVDGDATYEATDAAELVRRVREDGIDMAVGERVANGAAAFRSGHAFGNRALAGTVRRLFGESPGDMLSGYRALSRRLVKTFPARSSGFEIETELSVHALRIGAPVAMVPTSYGSRPDGSASKLRTYRDGWRILGMIGRLIARERPFAVWSVFAALNALVSLGLGLSVFREFERTGLVPRFPTAFLAGFLMVIAVLSMSVGLILDGIRRTRVELLLTAYLSVPGPQVPRSA